MRTTLRLLGALAGSSALLAAPLVAQRAVPATWAITNAKLVPVSGPTIDKGTIVIRDGLIAAIGATVAVPGDARVIDGAGLTVYPGLIDAYGSLGLSAEGATGGGGGRRGAPAAGPPGGGGGGAALVAQATAAARLAGSADHPAGFEPELKAIDHLKPDAEALSGPQSAGITSALTAPGSGILQGQSAFINLAGEDATAMIVKGGIAQHVGFVPARGGGYPNSLMGVFAALRQMLLDAQHYGAEQAAYAKNPRGMRRPEYDASLEALQPVLARTQPVVMLASTQREIERALDLAREFNFRPIIAGGSEAWKIADRLKAEGVPVLVSVNFPHRVAAPSADADPDPIRVLKDRVEAPKGPGRLAQAGVKIALESGGITNWPDFLSDVRTAVDNGLTADQAIKALTSQSAEVLGVSDRLGTLEVGKIANLTVTRGDLFDRSGRISQLFIDGKPIAIRPLAVNTAGGGNFGGGGGASSVSGTWTVNATLEGEDHPVTLSLRQEGTRLTGSLQGTLGANELAGSIGADGQFSFTVSITLKEGTEEATFSGTLEGNALRGRISIVGHNPGTFTGTRPDRGTGAPGGGRTRPPGR